MCFVVWSEDMAWCSWVSFAGLLFESFVAFCDTVVVQPNRKPKKRVSECLSMLLLRPLLDCVLSLLTFYIFFGLNSKKHRAPFLLFHIPLHSLIFPFALPSFAAVSQHSRTPTPKPLTCTQTNPPHHTDKQPILLLLPHGFLPSIRLA